MVTAAPGVYTPIMRFMEALTGSDGAGNQIYGSDYPPNNLFGYSGNPVAPWTGAGNWPTNNPTLTDNRQIPIYAIRKYDTVTQSPYVYCDQQYARTVTSNISNYPWMWDLSNWTPNLRHRPDGLRLGLPAQREFVGHAERRGRIRRGRQLGQPDPAQPQDRATHSVSEFPDRRGRNSPSPTTTPCR